MLDFDSIKLDSSFYNEDESLISENISENDIAIIGISAKLPKAQNVMEFWYNLRNGIDCVREIPSSRKGDIESYFRFIGRKSEDISYCEAAFIEEIDKFDYNFFNISPKEASLLDPNQRLFLQAAWNSIEDAGYGGNRIKGSKTGVYLGYGSDSDYKNIINRIEPGFAALAMPGNVRPIIASRISYILDLRGPSLVVDTTCSSSLTAIHLACQAIRNGECDMALAGGIQIHILPVREYEVGIESSNGRARTFDDSSDGTGTGEGIIVMLLKSLVRAKEDRDNIYAVIKSSCLNQDGSSIGLTAPNAKAQENVMVDAWNSAGIDPETIGYIEAHGTGTKLGDPIEIEGIERAFKRFTNKKQFCAVGSVKSNIGHLDNTAGIAGLLKAVLSLKHKEIFPTLHFTKPNKKIAFEDSPVYVNDRINKWDFNIDKRRCGISSFGLSGTNCHVVLEEAPDYEDNRNENNNSFKILTISAKTEEALMDLIKLYAEFWKENRSISLDDFCFTANTGRDHHNIRIALMIKEQNELYDVLCNIVEVGLQALPQQPVCYYSINSKTENSINESATREINDKLLECIRANKNKEELFREISNLYVNGAFIDWGIFYRNQNRNRISIPTYPFERKRCWVEIPTVQQENDLSANNYFYKMEWVKEELTDNSDIEKTNTVLIITHSKGKTNLISQQLINEKIDVVEVNIESKSLKHSDNKYSIDGSYESYVNLFKELENKDIRRIIHMASINTEASINSIDELNESQKVGVNSLLYIYKAIMNINLRQKIDIAIITKYAYRVNGIEERIVPEGAAMMGLGKVLGKENTNINVKLIDIDEATSPKDIVNEIFFREIPYQVSYRDSVRYIEQLTGVDIKNIQYKKTGIKDGGVYIITGGAGGIGIEIAKYIASRCNVRLVFINRTKIPKREQWDSILKNNQEKLKNKIKNIVDIEAMGSTVSCYSADVSDYDDMKSVIEQVRTNYGGIDGIIHSAGIAGEGFLINKEEETFNNVLLPKVHGTWILDYLTRKDKLDFYILFSSITSITGAPGQGDYTAANSYLDAFASYRNSIGKTTLTINWTGWKETGMAVGYIQDNDNSIFRSLTTKQAIEAFEMVLSDSIIDTDRIMIGDFNYNGTDFGKNISDIGIRVNEVLKGKCNKISQPINSTKQTISNKKIKDVTLKGKDNDSYTKTEKIIAGIWREVLGFEELSIDANFFEIGGDSILITKVHSLIEENYPGKLTMADLFSFSTIRKISEHINSFKEQSAIIEEDENYIKNQISELFDKIENGDITIDEAVNTYNLLEVIDG